MVKRVFIIHGWGGSPGGWHLWMRDELKKKGFEVFNPQMPNTDTPKIEEWVGHLEKLVGKADEDTYFLGHSIGSQAVMRYLERLPEGVKVGGVVFVAGFFYSNTERMEDLGKSIIKPWLETPIDCEEIKKHAGKIVAIFSDNDKHIPLKNKKLFAEKLHAKIIVEHNKGHYIAEDKISTVPVALAALNSMYE
ncbi:RBBP9/YdeN family alpha/beta hydrolase [Nanoarchaeota archaeon]